MIIASSHKIIILSVLLFFGSSFVRSQTTVFSFLDLPVSSRMAALGGKNVSLNDTEVQFAMHNPALLNSSTHKMLGLSMSNYLADIQFGTALYGWSKGKSHFAAGIQYVDYGTFKETTEFNEILGEFSAREMAISLIYSRELTTNLTAGVALKPVYSVYERYSSYGVAVDVGLNYSDADKLLHAGMVFRNIGSQLKGYYAGEDGQNLEPLPFNIQVGVSRKLRHAPFRFSLTLHNLQRWDLNYIDNNDSRLDYDRADLISQTSWLDMAFRHAIFGVEFLPNRNFYLAASYNHRRHRELRMEGFRSMAGFSFGGGVRVSRFQVGFSMSQFQVGNNAYQFSVATSLSEFKAF